MTNPLVIVVIVAFAALAVFIVRDVRLFLRARAFEVPISYHDVVAMRFKKVDPKVVLEAFILARQHNLEVAVSDMEMAYLLGANLEKAVSNMTAGRFHHGPVTTEELLEAGSQE